MNNNADRFSFISTAMSLMVTYVTSAVPIPLYGIYRAQDSITYFELSLSSVVYFIGAVASLVLFGRLSNFLGRKPIAIVSLILAALSTLFFMNLHSATPLILGRLCQGLACGLASTALTSWLVDHSQSVRSWIAPAIISCGPMTGLTIGGIGSGVLFEIAPFPRQLGFAIALLLNIIGICLLIISKETMKKQAGVLSSIKPNFEIPTSAKKAFPVAAVTFVSTWALGGFFQAFGPAMATEHLHSASAVVAAFVFASIMAPSSIGASIAGRMTSKQAQFNGMLFFTLFVACILISLHVGLLSAFLIASIFAGTAQGLVLTGSIGTMVTGLKAEERANVFSVIYATSYVGAAIPTLIAGRLSDHLSLLQIAYGYGLLALTGSVAVLAGKWRNKPQLNLDEQ